MGLCPEHGLYEMILGSCPECNRIGAPVTDLTPQEREWRIKTGMQPEHPMETGPLVPVFTTVVPKSRAEAAEARVAELEAERDEWRRLATEDDGTEARVAELEAQIKDMRMQGIGVSAEYEERMESRLHQATEALREIADETSIGADADRIMQRIARSALAGEDDGNTHKTTHGSPDDL